MPRVIATLLFASIFITTVYSGIFIITVYSFYFIYNNREKLLESLEETSLYFLETILLILAAFRYMRNAHEILFHPCCSHRMLNKDKI